MDNVKHWIADIVYLKTDTNQKERMVTGIRIYPTGIIYELTHCDSVSYHYDFEISIEKNVLKQVL